MWSGANGEQGSAYYGNRTQPNAPAARLHWEGGETSAGDHIHDKGIRKLEIKNWKLKIKKLKIENKKKMKIEHWEGGEASAGDPHPW